MQCKKNLDFCDLGPRESKTDHWILPILRQGFDVQVTTAPDYIIYGEVGDVHRLYSCCKIYLGKQQPDFSECDYAINVSHKKWNVGLQKTLHLGREGKYTQFAETEIYQILAFFKMAFAKMSSPVSSKNRIFGRWLRVVRYSC